MSVSTSQVFAAGLATAAVAAFAATPALADPERFVGVTVENQMVAFTSDDPAPATSVPVRGSGTIRISALERLPSGQVLAVDANGVVYDADVASGTLTPRAGTAEIHDIAIEGRHTVTAAPDGSSLLAARTGAAEGLDLTSGAVTPAQPLRYAADDPSAGRAVSPLLDLLPDGRLAGVDAGAGAVVAETSPGGGLRTLAGFPVELSGPTRVTTDPAGRVGWLVTRGPGGSRLVSINLVTGATDAPGIAIPAKIDAITAMGTIHSSAPASPAAVPDPPTGPPAEPGSKPRAHFSTLVSFSGHSAQSARSVVRRRGLLFSVGANGPVRVTATARLGGQVIARRTLRVPKTTGRPTSSQITLVRGGASRILHSAQRSVRVTFSVSDAGGTVLRYKTIRLEGAVYPRSQRSR